MKDSVKANLIVFLIIGLIALGISSAFASFTITEDNDSYKLIPIDNDSFEPNYINKVPTVFPKTETSTTNTTTNNTTELDINDTLDDLDYIEDDWDDLNMEYED